MDANELEEARRRLKYSKADLATALRTPYRTVQDWCSGARPIPGVVSVAVELLEAKDRYVMAGILAKLEGRQG